MELVVSLAALLGALTIGVISPGPSFVLVARTAIAGSRSAGLAAAAGMGLGGVIFAVLGLLGLHAVLNTVPWLYLVLKVAGGAYLLYLGICMWRGARQRLVIDETARPVAGTAGRYFLIALGAQLSNPKTAVVYGSIFAALLPRDLPLLVALALPPVIFVIETGWYAIVALALSSSSPRAMYLRAKTAVDRMAGGVLGLLGLKLMTSGNAAA